MKTDIALELASFRGAKEGMNSGWAYIYLPSATAASRARSSELGNGREIKEKERIKWNEPLKIERKGMEGKGDKRGKVCYKEA